jgi:hypothetical protein
MERLMAAQQHAQLVRLAAAEAAAAAGGVVGDSDSVAHMQLQQQGTIDLQHAASFALGSPTTAHHMLMGSLATAQQAAEMEAAAAAAAAAGPATGSGGGSSRDQRDQRVGRRRSHAANLEATGTSRGGESDDERVKRRREINRNSQKRIRERRNKEMDGLKSEVSSSACPLFLEYNREGGGGRTPPAGHKQLSCAPGAVVALLGVDAIGHTALT